MKRFIALFNKVGGWTVLKQYAKAHVLFYALVQTLLCGFSKKSLELVRLGVEQKIYRRLEKKFAKFRNASVQEHPAEKAHLCVRKWAAPAAFSHGMYTNTALSLYVPQAVD